MKFLNSNGKSVSVKRLASKRIKWEGKSRSKFQFQAKQFLKLYWVCDEVYEEFPLVGTRMTFDFYNHSRGIAIEIQGSSHGRYNSFHHQGNRMNFLNQVKRDMDKHEFCERNDLILIEVWSADEINEEFFLEHGAI